jgi:ribokinase
LHRGANYSAKEALVGPEITHLLLQNEIPFSSTVEYLHSAASLPHKVTTLFNPSPMPDAEQLQAIPWNLIDWLLLNEGEAVDIAQAMVGDAPAPMTVRTEACLPAQAQTALQVLSQLQSHPALAKVNYVCTLGALGVLVFQQTQEGPHIAYHPAAPLRNPLKDTTGAGDCFAGYFVAGLMRAEAMDSIIGECLTVRLRARSSLGT